MKPWYKSKTIWLNLLMVAIGITTLLPTSPVVPLTALPWITLANGILNIVLKVFFPNTPIQPLFKKVHVASP